MNLLLKGFIKSLFFIKFPFENVSQQIKKERKINANLNSFLKKRLINIGKYVAYINKQSVLRGSNVVYKFVCRVVESAVIVIDMVYVQKLLASCCILG